MLTSAQSAIAALKAELDAPRSTVFDVHASDENGRLVVEGVVLDQSLQELLAARLSAVGPLENRVTALGGGSGQTAAVSWSIADVRSGPSHGSELVTQALYGETVTLLRQSGHWWQIRQPDGYHGWISGYGLSVGAGGYRDQATHVVNRRLQSVYGLDGMQLTVLPWGTPLPISEFRDGMAYWMSPDGIPSYTDADTLIPIDDLPLFGAAGCIEALAVIQQFIGTPYLWGGTAAFGFDCSGLAQAYYRWMGHAISRDADQQARLGVAVERGDIAPGDLLFWAVNRDEGRHQNINHVSIAMDQETTIHSNQRRWGVTIDSIDEVQSRFDATGDPGLIAIRRLVQG